ncbi:MAG TPA: hypothetical protein VG053_11675 [Solirubrobacteraceae bacterium]|nr:hypothetical protein [Solirubrobacteraceae bacterium]
MTMKHSGRRLARTAAATVALTALTAGLGASAQADPEHGLQPGNLLVSRSVYTPDASLTAGVTKLPAGCVTGCVLANAGGSYPEVWNNDKVDESFGVTSDIFLDQLRPSGSLVNSLEVPSSSQPGVTTGVDQMVTSFSSKSELALNLSTRGRYVTFMGYLAPVDALDVSNSNTPGVIDPTDPVPGADYRVVAQLDSQGRFQFTETNAYSGNNGRAAILNEDHHHHVIYTAGNAGNGANPQPDGIIVGAGAQILKPAREPELLQEPGFPTPVGSFSVTQLGDKADKVGKDTNFRGLTIFNHVVYYTKGSGGNGVNTVYFLDTTGKACPTGVGLPVPGAKLPTWPLAYNPELLQSAGMKPYNMCILKGFPTSLKSKTSFPFGIWFANADTLYVADEGNGETAFSVSKNEYTEAAAQTTAGLQKWVFNSGAGAWQPAYTLQNGLQLGQPYTVPGYPTGNNPATGLPWSPGTDGLRNIDGRTNPDGTATIWGITSTVSGNGDQGADPNRLVAVTDHLDATTLPASEAFTTVRSAGYGEVLRGVSFTPGTGESDGVFSGGSGGRHDDGH